MAEERYPSAEIAEWVRAWRATRQLTYDLLRALPYAVMNFSPHPEFGTLIRQIRHVADIQACYIAAIRSGKMDFRVQPRQRALEQSKEHVEAYLRHLDGELLSTLKELPADQRARLIDWGPRERARLAVPRDFQWRAGGAVKKAYGTRVMQEFLGGRFDAPGELLRFEARDLSADSVAVLRRKLERLIAEFNESAEVDSTLPGRRRTAFGLLVACRPWEFSVMIALKKRKPAGAQAEGSRSKPA